MQQPPQSGSDPTQALTQQARGAGDMVGSTLGQVTGGGQQQQQLQQPQPQQQQAQQSGGGGKDTLKLRLDLNLEVDVQIKARVHGDVTLSLLD